MTEPPALISVRDEGVSGLWLWQGAPPDQQNAPNQQKGQRVPRRGALWLSIGAPLIVAALSTLAAFVLIVPRLPEPAVPPASSPAMAAIDTPSSPLVADTPASPPATVDTPAAGAAGASTPALAPLAAASVGTPGGMLAEPTARDQAAAPAPSRASASAPRGVSSQGSRPVATKPGAVSHRDEQRFARKPGRSLADLQATPAFQNGTLRPVPDH
jgi:hypothetical protein